MSDHSHDSESFAHPAPLKLLLGVFVALVVLTVLTVVVAKANLPVGRFEVWVAMGIATVKAFLVGAIFMHMWWEKPFNILFFLSSIVFVTLFVGFTLMDKTHYRDDVESFPAGELPAKISDGYAESDH